MKIFRKRYEFDYMAFLEGKIADNKGRKITDILAYGNIKLEMKHDYIQKVFPTAEASEYDNIMPMNEQDIKNIRNSEIARENITKMYHKMLKFYKLDDYRYKDWDMFRHWNTTGNHNHKRLTRMLKCFRLLGYDDLYKDLSMRIKYILTVYRSGSPKIHISDDTMDYWSLYV